MIDFTKIIILTLLCSSLAIEADAILENRPFQNTRQNVEGCNWWKTNDLNYNEQNRQEAEVYCKRSLLYLQQDRFELAIDSLTAAVRSDPNYLESYILRGLLYLKEKPELAIVDFNRAIEIDPDLVYSYMTRAGYYISQKQWQQAEANFDFVESIANKKQHYESSSLSVSFFNTWQTDPTLQAFLS